jgi:hypothetical protein
MWNATACPAAAPQPATTIFAVSNPAEDSAVGALKTDVGAGLGGGGALETLDDKERGSGVSVDILETADKEVKDQLLSLFAARQDIKETSAPESFLLPIPDDDRYERPSSGISRFGAEG